MKTYAVTFQAINDHGLTVVISGVEAVNGERAALQATNVFKYPNVFRVIAIDRVGV